MRKLLFLTLLGIASLGKASTTIATYQVIPQPQMIGTVKAPAFLLTRSTGIHIGSPELKNEADFLKQYVHQQTGIELGEGNGIRLTLNKRIDGNEAYRIRIRAKGITIEGRTSAGVFYGLQFLRKSIPSASADTVSFPAVDVSDAPRFGYRGAMIDCARHFFPVKTVKKFIDLLALHNLNTLHWHLTDDQGWRLPVAKWPRLTEVGAWRQETVIGHNSGLYDGTRYGGFYTREELKDVVAYAAKQHITVIPEVDLPGHTLSALAAYPELGCTGGPYKVATGWGVMDDILCPGKEKTFQFIDDVLDELMSIFPSKYIHLGGDEAPKRRWEKCPLCQKRIADEHLTAKNGHSKEDALQGYVSRRAEQYLLKHGRKMIGWDEVLDGDVDTSTVIMSWRGMEAGLKASQMGHDVIMSPTSHCYIDYYQNKNNDLILIGGYLPLSKVYSLEPAPESLTEEAKQHIIGPQVNLWTEYIGAPQLAFYQALPRMAALSEVGWTAANNKDFDSFKQRLPQLEKIYELMGVTYCRTME